MTAIPSLSKGSYGLPAGAWRWAALGFFFLALLAAGLAVGAPQVSQSVGVVLLVGIGLVALLLLYAVWPRTSLATEEAKRIAEAAARANVAWAVTGPDGAVLDCNDAYRQMARAPQGEAPPPPELALRGDSSAATLYRLARMAAAGKASEEALRVGTGHRDRRRGAAALRRTFGLVVRAALASNVGARTGSRRHHAGRIRSMSSAMRLSASRLPMPKDGFPTRMPNSRASSSRACRSTAAAFSNSSKRPTARSVADLVARVAAGGTCADAVEFRPAGESDRMAELYANALAGSEPKRAILYLIDVSEQKALETKFAQSQKMQAVGQLAGGVAHDFNNLLTVIIGNCEFLLMRHQAGDPSFKEIHEIHQNALRAATLVGQLLAFSRKQTLQPKVLSLRDVVGELALMLRRLLREGVELKLEHGADLWPVNADETQISNAIINLVVNARDAMPKGGTVTISTANESVAQAAALGTAIMPAGDYVCISVTDTGIGIPKEHLGKIFDPFFTTKPVGQGTGLGLATVYGIVKQTGGFITVDSEVGKGTSFHIYLPRHRGEAIAAANEPERAPPRDITGQDTILLVEDEEAVRSFAARALKLRGYNVLEAAGGEEALEIVQKLDGDDPSSHHRRRHAEHGRADAGARGQTSASRDGRSSSCRAMRKKPSAATTRKPKTFTSCPSPSASNSSRRK